MGPRPQTRHHRLLSRSTRPSLVEPVETLFDLVIWQLTSTDLDSLHATLLSAGVGSISDLERAATQAHGLGCCSSAHWWALTERPQWRPSRTSSRTQPTAPVSSTSLTSSLSISPRTEPWRLRDCMSHRSGPNRAGLPVQRPGDQRDRGDPRRHQGARCGSAGQLRHRCLAGLSPQVQLSSTGDVSTLVASITGVS